MNVFGRQVVSGAVCAAVDTRVRQIAMFGVVLARHPKAFGLAALATGRIFRLPVDGEKER
jgi:hypothetical protein